MSAAGPVGMWFSRGNLREVNTWAAKSVVPVLVARLAGYSVLMPRGRSAVGAPYDDAALMCASRLAPGSLAPAIGLWVINDRAVITVQEGRWRRTVNWVIWDPARGVLRPSGVNLATPTQVLTVAGGGRRDDLIEMLNERHHPPGRLLSAVAGVLGLPGAAALVDPETPSRWKRVWQHEPQDREVQYFEDAVAGAVALRRELGMQS